MTRPYTPRELLERIIPHLDKRKMRVRATKDGKQVMARCPFHDDDEPSLSLTLRNGKLLAHCFACGNVYDRLLALVDKQPATARPTALRNGHTPEPQTAHAQPLTVAEYARAKGLNAEKLRAWGLTDLKAGGIEIPYRDTDGNTVAVRYRLALEGANRFKWRSGDTPILYGLWRLDEWALGSDLYLCEGETDTLTLWHAGLPALGIPGASVWKSEWWRNLWEFGRIVIIPDADKAGEQLVQKLAETCPDALRERVQVLQLPNGIKDANELWQQLDADAERFRAALASSHILAIWQLLKQLPDCQKRIRSRPAAACASERTAHQRRRTRTGVCSAAGRGRANRARDNHSTWRTPQSR